MMILETNSVNSHKWKSAPDLSYLPYQKLHIVFCYLELSLVFTLWFKLTLLLNSQLNLAQHQSVNLLFQKPIIIE